MTAYRLLRDPKIAKAIDDALALRGGSTRTRIVDELAKVAFASAGDYVEWGPDWVKAKCSSDLTDEQKASVAEITKMTDGRVRVTPVCPGGHWRLTMDLTPLAVSIAEAVKLSGNSRTAIYQAIASGALLARKRGRRTLILYSDLQRWLASLPEVR